MPIWPPEFNAKMSRVMPCSSLIGNAKMPTNVPQAFIDPARIKRDAVRPEPVFPIVLSLSKEGLFVVPQAHHERFLGGQTV